MTGGRDRTAPWRGFRPGCSKEVSSSPIDAIVGKGAREGARRMRAEALQAERMPISRRTSPSGTIAAAVAHSIT